MKSNRVILLLAALAIAGAACAGGAGEPGTIANAQTACNEEVECTSDDQCTLTADYCHGGCDCVPGPAHASFALSCPDPVACFVDPCIFFVPFCNQGVCDLAPAWAVE